MSAIARFRLLFVCLILVLVPFASASGADTPRVYVVLWFDTEDYMLPASDDAALHVADFLTREGVKATFKVVGEKARTLEKRERKDVIAALKKHEIGYHSNYHSVQPSPAMYLSNLGWDEGVTEFDRRERPGYDDVKRIFGQAPSCYGQPGSSWGPQVFGAMKKWGMSIYLDAGNHVRLDDKPYYYGGAFNLYKLAYQLRADLNKPAELEKAEDRFLAAKQLLADGGGLISIFYHPCEFVHKEFWDAVNFRDGANPPREQWKKPPQKSDEETRSSYEVFENYVRFMKRFADVRFITATEAAKLYRDKAQNRKFTGADLKGVAAAACERVNFQQRDDYSLSASEVFALLNEYVALKTAGKDVPSITLNGTPDGPSNPVTQLTESVMTDDSQLARTAADVADFLKKQGRVPTSIWLGSTAVPPESYLLTLADVVSLLAEGKSLPKTIEVKPAKFAAAKYVHDDGPKALWGWIIFPKGFRAPAMMELAKRQAWTLKPAILDRNPE